MPKGDFGNKRNTEGFDKNKQNINKKGAGGGRDLNFSLTCSFSVGVQGVSC